MEAGKAGAGLGSGGRAAGLTSACRKSEQSGSDGQGHQGKTGSCGDIAGKPTQARRPSQLSGSLPRACPLPGVAGIHSMALPQGDVS